MQATRMQVMPEFGCRWIIDRKERGPSMVEAVCAGSLGKPKTKEISYGVRGIRRVRVVGRRDRGSA